MCKAHSKVTHLKQLKYFHHLKRPGYNTEFLLYPRPFRWWKYFCCFICVTLLWALHIVIKQQFFLHLYVCMDAILPALTCGDTDMCSVPFLQLLVPAQGLGLQMCNQSQWEKKIYLHLVCDCGCLSRHCDCVKTFSFYFSTDSVKICSEIDFAIDFRWPVVSAAHDPSGRPDAVQTSHHETADVPFCHGHGKALHGTRNVDGRVTTEETVDHDEWLDDPLKNRNIPTNKHWKYKAQVVLVQSDNWIVTTPSY